MSPEHAATLQANRVARDLLAQMEARALAAEARVNGLRLEALKALQDASVLREQLRQNEFNYVEFGKSRARGKALDEALRDLRTAAVNARGLISRMRDYVPVRSEFWERYSAEHISEMLAALESADERAAAALKGGA